MDSIICRNKNQPIIIVFHAKKEISAYSFFNHLQGEWARPQIQFGVVSEKTRILIKPGSILEVHDPFSFSAPPFTGPRKHARLSSVLLFSTAARERFRFARACMICGLSSPIKVM